MKCCMWFLLFVIVFWGSCVNDKSSGSKVWWMQMDTRSTKTVASKQKQGFCSRTFGVSFEQEVSSWSRGPSCKRGSDTQRKSIFRLIIAVWLDRVVGVPMHQATITRAFVFSPPNATDLHPKTSRQRPFQEHKQTNKPKWRLISHVFGERVNLGKQQLLLQ